MSFLRGRTAALVTATITGLGLAALLGGDARTGRVGHLPHRAGAAARPTG